MRVFSKIVKNQRIYGAWKTSYSQVKRLQRGYFYGAPDQNTDFLAKLKGDIKQDMSLDTKNETEMSGFFDKEENLKSFKKLFALVDPSFDRGPFKSFLTVK